MSSLSLEMILLLFAAIALSLFAGFMFGLPVWCFCAPAIVTPCRAQVTGSRTNLQMAPRRNSMNVSSLHHRDMKMKAALRLLTILTTLPPLWGDERDTEAS
nr:hypothetical protein CFP56_52103 [Quercus suber]